MPSGLYEVTMAIGVEKLYTANKMETFANFMGAIDIENCLELIKSQPILTLSDEHEEQLTLFQEKYGRTSQQVAKKKLSIFSRMKEIKDALVVGIDISEKLGYGTLMELRKYTSGDHSPFMDIYAHAAREHMKKYGTTVEQFAAVASKSHFNSTLNPNAQYCFAVPIEKVLKDRMISYPITRSMCAPIGDGAASAIVCSENVVQRLGLKNQAVKIRASLLGSGAEREFGSEEIPPLSKRLSQQAYEKAGVGPKDINIAEVHDATAYGEVVAAENLGFCPIGEGGIFAESGETKLDGKIPINPSGGLISRGHPIGASGLGQIHELVTQLRGDAGKRQVHDAKLALAENGGGVLGTDAAAMCIHILESPSASNHAV